jgi:hypothetical protein
MASGSAPPGARACSSRHPRWGRQVPGHDPSSPEAHASVPVPLGAQQLMPRISSSASARVPWSKTLSERVHLGLGRAPDPA